ncbi:hypothetical protein GCM10011575_35220 [Microlunatus endophyticus]|uniref:HTH tetR-type domain-containing protein n=2 Tax=Microlunatus endophyticus TaxID=1716077 RepID=A0A917W7T9_9ACTN|nr:hypothetical protein GCM10011575_35220 [Microlunatus endophyticus]
MARRNRGPAAAAANRESILSAARRLFAERGYDVPLSAIAKGAGVGQGVLYRHFPTRLDLAFAVFEDHFQQYAMTAALPGPDAFCLLWRGLVDNLIAETAFIDMVSDARKTRVEYDGARRLIDLLADPLRRAVEAGLVPTDVTVEEVMLSIRMAYGIVRTAEAETTPDDLRTTILDAFPRLRCNDA